MNILLAPDSYKGSISSVNAIRAMRSGIHRIAPDITTIGTPLSDGGEGFVDALVTTSGGIVRRKKVTGPLGKPVMARYGIIDNGKTGIIEMAAAAGLPLVSHKQRNPLRTTTYGVGELILTAIKNGCTTIIIGAGGSATVDGGVGLLRALGAVFLDKNGKKVGVGGRELLDIHSMNIDALSDLSHVTFMVATDVYNPLCGRQGAARVYGPQKGATPDAVKLLDRGLNNFARRIKQELDYDVRNVPGSGAAGGMAAGIHALLGADIIPGVDVVLDRSGIDETLIKCDLVITGEGRTDRQTLQGKAPLGIVQRAQKHSIPVVCISGSLGEDIDNLYQEGFSAFFSLCDGPISEATAMKHARRLLADTAENVIRLLYLKK